MMVPEIVHRDGATVRLYSRNAYDWTERLAVNVGQVAVEEILLRLVEGEPENDNLVLKRKLRLTERESEVLMWIARGKSNRDIAEILNLSPRTVNKHLEQIIRSSALRTSRHSALAVRMLRVR
jgi:DNA-binding CsgD family transcriptional regulator